MDDIKEILKDTLKGNNPEKKYIIVYSSYGYIKIAEKDLNNNSLTIYEFIQYKGTINNPDNALKGWIFKNNFKDSIDIKVKYFQNKINLFSFEKIASNI